MKTFILLFIFSFTVAKVQPADPVDKTVGLLKQSTWAEFYKTLASSVDITILDESDIYHKQQAEAKLNAFFTKNQPFNVKLVHRVDSKPDLKFAVVVLSGKNGSYRTSFSLRNNNGTFEVNELRIEAEKIK
jgi:hypothetical protein